MFIKIGRHIVNLDRVHSIDVHDGDGVALVVDHHDPANPGQLAQVLRVQGPDAKALRDYLRPQEPEGPYFVDDLSPPAPA